MISLSIDMNGDGAWKDVKREDLIVIENGKMQVAVLAGGMASGRPSVAFRLDLPDGRCVAAQTSARMIVTLARLIEGKYPDVMVDAARSEH